MDCNTCKEEQKQTESVSRWVFESMKATMERSNKRLWIAVIILIALLFGTNFAWVCYENQWEAFETTIEAEQTTDNGNNYAVGGDLYGEAESSSVY